MAWEIKCNKAGCGCIDWAANIVDLIKSHTDKDGWIRAACGSNGYIEKSFALQEEGEKWEPFLRGVIPLGVKDDTYQPFVFLVSYKPNAPIKNAWFSYYKDLRGSGGRLKLGYGPGGPPVLGFKDIIRLVDKLIQLKLVNSTDLDNLLNKNST